MEARGAMLASSEAGYVCTIMVIVAATTTADPTLTSDDLRSSEEVALVLDQCHATVQRHASRIDVVGPQQPNASVDEGRRGPAQTVGNP